MIFLLRTKATEYTTEYDSLKMKQYSKPKIYHGGTNRII